MKGVIPPIHRFLDLQNRQRSKPAFPEYLYRGVCATRLAVRLGLVILGEEVNLG